MDLDGERRLLVTRAVHRNVPLADVHVGPAPDRHGEAVWNVSAMGPVSSARIRKLVTCRDGWLDAVRSTAMAAANAALMVLVRAIVVGDTATVSQLLAASPGLATVSAEDGATRQNATAYYLGEIGHYLYAGDTALHVAGAAYRRDPAGRLVDEGADIHAKNRRGAEPLHYAVDGGPGSSTWNPDAQATTVAYLIKAGADPNATDRSGVTPLHRAVRTRCAAAVQALLNGGADPRLKNKSGSTPMTLATQNTGRGGSGSLESKAQQEQIVRLLEQHGAPR